MDADWAPRGLAAGLGLFRRGWRGSWLLWLAAGLPLVLAGAWILALVSLVPLAALDRGAPVVESLSIERIHLLREPSRLVVRVVNGGPAEVTIAQVLVDDAYWAHQVEPDRTIPRLGRAEVTIPYPWVMGEPHEVKLLSAVGTVFRGQVPVAVESPTLGAEWGATLAMVGVSIGVIPVALGLLWYPLLRQLDRRWLHAVLAATAGLLAFLAADAFAEAMETAASLPAAYHGPILVVVALVVALAALQLAGGARPRPGHDDVLDRRRLAVFVAFSIGLHNLGEGMAVGAAYSVGEIALGAALVIGFALHNVTEGVGIAAPVARDRVGVPFLAGVGLLAGAPTVLGAWLGGLSYLPLVAALCFAVGAAAALQVIGEIGALLSRRDPAEWRRPENLAGFAAGLAAMYLTALAVAG